MNMIQKSEAIKAGLRKEFQDGSSKMAKRKCYGYDILRMDNPKFNFAGRVSMSTEAEIPDLACWWLPPQAPQTVFCTASAIVFLTCGESSIAAHFPVI